ncbi:tetratricopeptide repeat protein [Vibrio rotiferianus]|uniref:tetratricopeptide repeat protein n=1 Tax=Vibrio rotiferianus TaxID=190895 RepID=UPI003394B947
MLRFFHIKGQILVGLLCLAPISITHANTQNTSPSMASAQQYMNANELDQAYLIYSKHGELGDPLAQFTLGLFHENGWGKLASDMTLACYYFYEASKQHIPQALKKVGDCIASQTLSLQIKKESHPNYWYKKAYENGIYEAACDLGRLYLGSDWQGFDLDEAIRWCHLAAEKKALNAQVTLGDIYASRTLSSYNIEKAEFWYQQAVNGDSGIAAFKLAKLYLSLAQNAEHPEKFYRHATLMMEQASSLKHAAAYSRTAVLYWNEAQLSEGEQASERLAKSYVWAKVAYRDNPTTTNALNLQTIQSVVPKTWFKELDDKVEQFLE